MRQEEEELADELAQYPGEGYWSLDAGVRLRMVRALAHDALETSSIRSVARQCAGCGFCPDFSSGRAKTMPCICLLESGEGGGEPEVRIDFGDRFLADRVRMGFGRGTLCSRLALKAWWKMGGEGVSEKDDEWIWLLPGAAQQLVETPTLCREQMERGVAECAVEKKEVREGQAAARKQLRAEQQQEQNRQIALLIAG